MKVTVYIEKNDFDDFFKWMNRINLGLFSTPPVAFSHREEDIKDPLNVSLDSREYAIIRDVRKDIEEIQKLYGPIDIDFSPQSTQSHLLLIQDIMRQASRHDLANEVVYAALMVMKQLPDISPVEAIIIAEREWIP